jgi:Tfp pilus assembly protein PilF
MARDQFARALADMRLAIEVDRDALPSYYVRAAIYARLDEYSRSRQALEQAIAIDPDAFASWLLLGDIAVRDGDLASARAEYRRASALDPRDTYVSAVAANPELAALSLGRGG